MSWTNDLAVLASDRARNRSLARSRLKVLIGLAGDGVLRLRPIGLQLAQRFPAGRPHLIDRPAAGFGPFEPHFGVVPIQGGLEVTPVQTLELILYLTKPLRDSPQP